MSKYLPDRRARRPDWNLASLIARTAQVRAHSLIAAEGAPRRRDGGVAQPAAAECAAIDRAGPHRVEAFAAGLAVKRLACGGAPFCTHEPRRKPSLRAAAGTEAQFTTGTVETQSKLGRKINYFPLRATQTFDTRTMAITNGIYLGSRTRMPKRPL